MIRHRLDYGAIIFCDARFAQQKAIAQMPSWVRPNVTVSGSFGESQRSLSQFFKTLSLDPTLFKPASSAAPKHLPAEGARAPSRTDALKQRNAEKQAAAQARRTANAATAAGAAGGGGRGRPPALALDNMNDDDDDDEVPKKRVSSGKKPKPPSLLNALAGASRPQQKGPSAAAAAAAAKRASAAELAGSAAESAESDESGAARPPFNAALQTANRPEMQRKISAKASSLYAAATAEPEPEPKKPPRGVKEHVAKVKSTLTANEFRRFTQLYNDFDAKLFLFFGTISRAFPIRHVLCDILLGAHAHSDVD